MWLQSDGIEICFDTIDIFMFEIDTSVTIHALKQIRVSTRDGYVSVVSSLMLVSLHSSELIEDGRRHMAIINRHSWKSFRVYKKK